MEPLDEDVTKEKERVQSDESKESDVLRVTDLSKVWAQNKQSRSMDN